MAISTKHIETIIKIMTVRAELYGQNPLKEHDIPTLVESANLTAIWIGLSPSEARTATSAVCNKILRNKD